MNAFFLTSAILLTAIILIPTYRLVKGPTVYDRLIAVNAVATKTLVLIVLIGYLFGRIDMFIDITLAYAILGFIGSLTLAKYITTKAGREDA
jgi:multicomponent Na+:H+ antiporter subunit F